MKENRVEYPKTEVRKVMERERFKETLEQMTMDELRELYVIMDNLAAKHVNELAKVKEKRFMVSTMISLRRHDAHELSKNQTGEA